MLNLKRVTHLSVLLSRLESNSQLISGVGFPDAMHFKCRDTPGCMVLSLKYSLIWGGSTVGTQRRAWNNHNAFGPKVDSNKRWTLSNPTRNKYGEFLREKFFFFSWNEPFSRDNVTTADFPLKYTNKKTPTIVRRRFVGVFVTRIYWRCNLQVTH